MTTEGRTALTLHEDRTTALALPDEQQFRRDIEAINRFQKVVHATMIKDLDYGVIPGTQKPTLLKPGAEKIAKLLGLSDQYEIMDRAEDWKLPFFRFLIKCRLIHVATGSVISEGLGECNSMESKYRYRWIGERDLPAGVDKAKLISQERHSKTGGHWTVYRLDNEDIYSQVNTILKMAKKRALVDAALSAGRLSDVFTQDIEDMANVVESEARTTVEEPDNKAAPQKGAGEKRRWTDKAEDAFPSALEKAPTPQPASVPTTMPPKISPRDLVLSKIMERKGYKSIMTAKQWLINVCKIPAEKLDSDDLSWYDEVKQLQGWKD